MQKNRHLSRLAATVIALFFSSPAVHAQGAPQELTSEFVYKYLVGEVAGQRGEIGLASSLFYELAKSSRDPQLAERAARAAAYGNQQQLAIRAAILWAELDPESTEARQAVAQMLISTGKLGDARPYLQKLLAVEETRANGFLYLNGILARHPDKAAVLKLVQELAKPYPDLPEAHFTVAHSAWNAGKTDLALKELNITNELYAGWELAAMLQGEIMLSKSAEDALRFYRGFLEQYPSAHDVRLTYAKLLVNQKQFDAARQQFTQLLDASNSNPEMPVIVGLLAVQLGDYPQADSYFKKALEQGFKDPDQLYLYLGQSAEKQQKDEEALDWYRHVQEGDHYFDAQLRIASLLAHQGKLDEARKFLHGLPDLASEQQVAACQLEASLLMQARKPQEAFAVLENAVKTLPNTLELIYDYAMAAEKVQRFDIMEKQLRTLIALKPDFAQAYNALGYTLAERNERLEEAMKLIEKALALSPDDYYILDSMGWVHYRLGQLDKALDYLRRAYSVKTDPEIAAHLGEVLWQQGKHEEAQKTWGDALREYPGNEALLESIKKFSQ